MYLKSPYPNPPPIPDRNVHHLMFDCPGYSEALDYTIHVDALTGRTRSWSRFKDMVYDGATALTISASCGGIGLDTRDIVGILSHNCMNYISLIHSLLVTATPIALLPAASTTFELIHALRTAKVTRLFVQPILLPHAREVARQVGISQNEIYLLEGHDNGVQSYDGLIDNVRRRKLPRVPVREVSRDTLAYLVFSSGTTGLPKAVMISHGNLWAMLTSSAIARAEELRFLKMSESSVPPKALTFLPMYHSFGVHVGCFQNFALPITFVILPKWDVEAVLKAIPVYKINILPMFPSGILQLVNHPLAVRTDMSSVVSVASGAAYLPQALQEKVRKILNVPFVGEGYGASELTLTAVRKPRPGLLGLYPGPGCSGALLPGIEAQLLREDGSHVEIGETGELWIKSPTVAMGYFGNDAATRETFVSGWLRTGDTFRADEDGLLYFVDRQKDTLKVSGVQVSPTEIEDVLMAHPEQLLQECTVAGVSGGRTSDEKIPRAFIVLSKAGRNKGVKETVEALDEWSRTTLSRYKWVRGGFEVLDQIPKTPTGKVLRRTLQDRYEQSKIPVAKL